MGIGHFHHQSNHNGGFFLFFFFYRFCNQLLVSSNCHNTDAHARMSIQLLVPNFSTLFAFCPLPSYIVVSRCRHSHQEVSNHQGTLLTQVDHHWKHHVMPPAKVHRPWWALCVLPSLPAHLVNQGTHARTHTTMH